MKPNFSIRKSIPLPELEPYLRKWETRAPGWVKVYSLGDCAGWPILCAEFTDPSVPAEEKSVAIITAQHSGMEISGMTTVLSVGNYLSARDEKARAILATQTVLLVPCPNCEVYLHAEEGNQYRNKDYPDLYLNKWRIDDYPSTFLDDEFHVDPEKTPAGSAIRNLVDKWKPELIVDVHGVWFEEAHMMEIQGAMSFSHMNRTFDRRFTDSMQEAAEAEGFAIVNEDQMETLFPMDPICNKPEYSRRFRSGMPKMLIGSYSYLMYHTLSLNMEVAWERSGFVRVLRALELGTAQGYPVDTMIAQLNLCDVRVGGRNAAERRESREELWQQNERFGIHMVYPATPGIVGFALVNDCALQNRLFGTVQDQLMDDFLDNMEQEGYSMSEVRTALDGKMDVWFRAGAKATAEKATVKCGLTLRLGIPYADATPTGIWLNGRRLNESEYSLVRRKNWTYADLLIPRGDLPDILFAVALYDYTPKPTGILEF